jgi:hypothetical protein
MASAPSAPVAPPTLSDEDMLVYPPARKGLPAASVEDILARQSDLIRRLEDGMGTTPEIFEGVVRPVIRCFAAFVQLPRLPRSVKSAAPTARHRRSPRYCQAFRLGGFLSPYRHSYWLRPSLRQVSPASAPAANWSAF